MATRNQTLAAEVQTLTQANANMSQRIAALQQQIQQLIQAQQAQQQPPPAVAAAAAQPVPLVGPGAAAAHQRAQANNGIAGYENERSLTQEELAYIVQIMGLGVNRAATNELFRHGYNENKQWKKIKAESIGHLVTNVTKNKSPFCRASDPVFYGHSFGDKISILVNWIEHQESIGSPATSVVWNQTPNVEEVNEQRMRYIAEKKKSKNTDDIKAPESLKTMKSIASFKESLMAYLGIKRGKTGVPLAYVLRKVVAVTDEQRQGEVGPGKMYEHWDEYLVACTVHSGDHWVADNTDVYTILSALIRNGPGWHYIEPSSHKKRDGRALWERLLEQAYDVSNVDQICDDCRDFYISQSYSGPTRNMDFDKYCRSWFENNKKLSYHGRLPPQRDIVADFIRSLDLNNTVFQTAALSIKQDPIIRNDFNKAITRFKQAVGNSHLAKPKGKRNISEINGGAAKGRATTDVSGKDYSKSTKKLIEKGEWRRMTPEQQADFRKAKAKRKQQNQNQSSQPNPSNGKSQNRFDKRIRKALAAIAQEKEDKEDKDNAGDQFGAQAHGGGSSKRRTNNQ